MKAFAVTLVAVFKPKAGYATQCIVDNNNATLQPSHISLKASLCGEMSAKLPAPRDGARLIALGPHGPPQSKYEAKTASQVKP